MQSPPSMDMDSSRRRQGERYRRRVYFLAGPWAGMVLPVPIRPANPYDYGYILDNVLSTATRDGDDDDDDDDGGGGFGDGDYPAAPAAHGRGGAATDEAIVSLQEVAADRSRLESGEECAVCLQGFCADETLRAMPCSHAFHRHCISEWLRRNAACPLCRRRLPEEEEDDDDKQKQKQRRRIEV